MVPKTSRVSRRRILKSGAAALGGAATLLGGGSAAGAEAAQVPGPRPGETAARRFRAFVRHGSGASVEELRMLPIQPREVIVRTEASGVCYTITGGVMATTQAQRASIPNHSGMGVVEEVGPLVKRVQPGDRVIVPGTPQCGQCFQCLQGRADHCRFLTVDQHPIARMADGTDVFAGAGLGGLSELMIVYEEYCCPVFTAVPGAELTMLGDTVGTGLAAGMDLISIFPGSDVVVQGAGPVGMGAIQSARIMGAAQIIVLEPIAYRREAALKLGATVALDPNAEGDTLVEHIRGLCSKETDRRFAGGTNAGGRGADFTINACGGDTSVPRVEQVPDPTGILPLQQALQFTRPGGHIVTLGFQQRGAVSFPVLQFVNSGRTFHAGQQGGLNMMRDLPRFVKLIEKGLLDVRSVVTATYALDRTREAVQAVADRTTLGAVVTF